MAQPVECSGKVRDLLREMGVGEEGDRWLAGLWAKSRSRNDGRINLLVSHLFDAAAVGGELWDCFLPRVAQRMLNRVSGGQGRLFFMWLCGMHDCGKACPAFQVLDTEGAELTKRAGLTWRGVRARTASRDWHHTKAGATILQRRLPRDWEGSTDEHIAWVWPLIAGHHGAFPDDASTSRFALGQHQGTGSDWKNAQDLLVDVVTRAIGYPGIAAVRPTEAPTRAEQMYISGLIIMVDWIASDSGNFPGLERLDEVSFAAARKRARDSVSWLRLRRGWGELEVPGCPDLIQERFGRPARAFQRVLLDMAARVPAPGLFVVEAPMGEGKTKGALGASEVLASRFGCDGVFIGMPTQATSDPIYSEVLDWVQNFDSSLPQQVGLLHGKRMFNEEWRGIWGPSQVHGLESRFEVGCDDFGMPDEFGMPRSPEDAEPAGLAPVLWFLGRHRGLLAPFGVGTVDQVLLAATRTKHVMLRFAGLAGKVVVLDEVHAADVYMGCFLEEALRWLGQAGVPVILLSATLPPPQRRILVRAYLSGATGDVDASVAGLPSPAGYPSIIAAFAEGGSPGYLRSSAVAPWRAPLRVRTEYLPDTSDDGAAVAAFVKAELEEGGAALVILNKVERAQAVYRALVGQWGTDEVHLLHGRLCATHRADRTQACVDALRDSDRDPSDRLIVVATQVAEQSFDVDADILVTDIAPVDLLLQRIGRLHRHEGRARLPRFSRPRVVVTGVAFEDGIPEFLPASEAIYGRYRLLRSTALFMEGRAQGGWSIPDAVPGLVDRGYGDDQVCPPEWADDEKDARSAWERTCAKREDVANQYLLSRASEQGRNDLAGLHHGGLAREEESKLEARVRDGAESMEVVIVHKDGRRHRALTGERFDAGSELSDDVRQAVIGGTTRLPARLTSALKNELTPLEGWKSDPWLRFMPALELGPDRTASVAGFIVGYDDLEGLTFREEDSRN